MEQISTCIITPDSSVRLRCSSRYCAYPNTNNESCANIHDDTCCHIYAKANFDEKTDTPTANQNSPYTFLLRVSYLEGFSLHANG